MTPSAYLRALPERQFVRNADLPGSASAVRNALWHAEKKGELLSVRRGLYYKGVPSRYGMTSPRTVDIIREVLGDEGVGPTGYSAARALGLTTQIPAKLEITVAGPIPEPIVGVQLHKRNNMRRRSLRYEEIALLELLRDPDAYVEGGWSALVSATRAAIERGTLRPEPIRSAAEKEPGPEVRQRLISLMDSVTDRPEHSLTNV
jgi:hypothetical protein